MQQKHSFFILIVGVVIGLFLDINLSMASGKRFETFNPESVRTWSFFSDGVMGGVSSGKALLKKSGQDNFVRIEGNVSTDNNGGFIQIRHNLIKPLEETTRGLRLKVRGNGEKYYIHLMGSESPSGSVVSVMKLNHSAKAHPCQIIDIGGNSF